MTVTGTFDPAGLQPSLINTATVSSPVADPDGADNTARTTTPTATSAGLSLVKTVDPATLVPGVAGSYTLTVANAGPSDAQQAGVSDTLPDGLLVTDPILADQGSCTLSGRTVSCDLGTVANGGTVTVTIPFSVDAGSTAASLTNSATATSPTPDPDAADNTSTVTAPVSPAADLTLTKTGPDTV